LTLTAAPLVVKGAIWAAEALDAIGTFVFPGDEWLVTLCTSLTVLARDAISAATLTPATLEEGTVGATCANPFIQSYAVVFLTLEALFITGAAFAVLAALQAPSRLNVVESRIGAKRALVVEIEADIKRRGPAPETSGCTDALEAVFVAVLARVFLSVVELSGGAGDAYFSFVEPCFMQFSVTFSASLFIGAFEAIGAADLASTILKELPASALLAINLDPGVL